VLVPLAIAVAACSRDARPTASADAALQNDLKLASASTLTLANARGVNPANFRDLETQPHSAPAPATHLKKESGPRAVASRAPDIKAAPQPTIADNQPAPQAQTIAVAPAPLPTTDPVASVPHPAAQPTEPAASTGAGEYGRSGDGGGIFGGMGPVIGVVIRGGGVDGDHCEPHNGRGRRPGVYIPPIGGMGGSRFPMIRP
jgi:hypothetical protein